LDEFKNKDGDPMGVIVQKKDGGFLYTTTDIAAAKYRYETLKANRALVFSDTRQSQHMQQAWLITRKAGYVPDSFQLEHKNFGMMLGKDGKPFKTRSGDTVKLADLLDEAIERAGVLISQKSTALSEQEKADVIEAVGIGSVKYADLSKNRTTDYVFDWDNMLSFEGNTAPYMQYAYTRIRSIFNRSQIDLSEGEQAQLSITDEKERALAIKLLQFEEAVQVVGKEGTPHVLCAYLYELAGAFSSFYEHCPILNHDDQQVKLSRLKLALLTERTLKQGLDLLGIKTVEKSESHITTSKGECSWEFSHSTPPFFIKITTASNGFPDTHLKEAIYSSTTFVFKFNVLTKNPSARKYLFSYRYFSES